MRKISLLALTVCFFAATATAASAAELKVGVFSAPEVIMGSDAFKESEKKINDAYGKERDALEKKDKEMQKKIDDFNKQQAALSTEARQDRQVALMREKRDLDDKKNDYMRKVTAANDRMRNDLMRALVIAVNDYGKRNKYTMLIDSAGGSVLFVDASVDVTPDIVKEINRVWKEKPKALTDGRPLTTGRQ